MRRLLIEETVGTRRRCNWAIVHHELGRIEAHHLGDRLLHASRRSLLAAFTRRRIRHGLRGGNLGQWRQATTTHRWTAHDLRQPLHFRVLWVALFGALVRLTRLANIASRQECMCGNQQRFGVIGLGIECNANLGDRLVASIQRKKRPREHHPACDALWALQKPKAAHFDRLRIMLARNQTFAALDKLGIHGSFDSLRHFPANSGRGGNKSRTPFTPFTTSRTTAQLTL